MNNYNWNKRFRAGLLAATLLAATSTTRAADIPVTLRDAFKEQFQVGTAVNRSMVSGGPGFRRSTEQSAKDIALLKEHFNQITAENDMKWEVIHPRQGNDGYDFGQADAQS